MTFLDFYVFDLSSLVIILLIALFSFMAINYIDENKDENYAFNVVTSIILGIFCSIFYSYITLEPDDILTTNYWE